MNCTSASSAIARQRRGSGPAAAAPAPAAADTGDDEVMGQPPWAISRDLTVIFRKRLAGQSPDDASCAPSRGMARALTRRRKADDQE
jgi:hypothetical protein